MAYTIERMNEDIIHCLRHEFKLSKETLREIEALGKKGLSLVDLFGFVESEDEIEDILKKYR